ncbi:synaptonemal complex protein 1-like [Lytechinus pictus]|uniref:synaptonemal complex protein 1-like n=1 Tax=Lytechinus pictus TaxID=7653 RepID=UPI0030B9DB56
MDKVNGNSNSSVEENASEPVDEVTWLAKEFPTNEQASSDMKNHATPDDNIEGSSEESKEEINLGTQALDLVTAYHETENDTELSLNDSSEEGEMSSIQSLVSNECSSSSADIVFKEEGNSLPKSLSSEDQPPDADKMKQYELLKRENEILENENNKLNDEKMYLKNEIKTRNARMDKERLEFIPEGKYLQELNTENRALVNALKECTCHSKDNVLSLLSSSSSNDQSTETDSVSNIECIILENYEVISENENDYCKHRLMNAENVDIDRPLQTGCTKEGEMSSPQSLISNDQLLKDVKGSSSFIVFEEGVASLPRSLSSEDQPPDADEKLMKISKECQILKKEKKNLENENTRLIKENVDLSNQLKTKIARMDEERLKKFSIGRTAYGTEPSTTSKKEDSFRTCRLEDSVGRFSFSLIMLMLFGQIVLETDMIPLRLDRSIQEAVVSEKADSRLDVVFSKPSSKPQ